jgi:hypothetical protein
VGLRLLPEQLPKTSIGVVIFGITVVPPFESKRESLFPVWIKDL